MDYKIVFGFACVGVGIYLYAEKFFPYDSVNVERSLRSMNKEFTKRFGVVDAITVCRDVDRTSGKSLLRVAFENSQENVLMSRTFYWKGDARSLEAVVLNRARRYLS